MISKTVAFFFHNFQVFINNNLKNDRRIELDYRLSNQTAEVSKKSLERKNETILPVLAECGAYVDMFYHLNAFQYVVRKEKLWLLTLRLNFLKHEITANIKRADKCITKYVTKLCFTLKIMCIHFVIVMKDKIAF